MSSRTRPRRGRHPILEEALRQPGDAGARVVQWIPGATKTMQVAPDAPGYGSTRQAGHERAGIGSFLFFESAGSRFGPGPITQATRVRAVPLAPRTRVSNQGNPAAALSGAAWRTVARSECPRPWNVRTSPPGTSYQSARSISRRTPGEGVLHVPHPVKRRCCARPPRRAVDGLWIHPDPAPHQLSRPG
jgi:hypothetical protein